MKSCLAARVFDPSRLRASSTKVISAITAVLALASSGSSADGVGLADIRVDGSTGVMPLAKAVVESWQGGSGGLTTAFGEGMGTSERIDALVAGDIDLAIASHGLDFERFEEAGLTVHLFARMVVVFAVHDSVPVRDLTSRQILDIYRGEIFNWKSLGGPDLAIVPLIRPRDEVDWEVVAEHIEGFAELTFSEQVRVGKKSGDLAKMLDTTPGAIGMTTLSRVARGEHVVVVKLNGVAGSTDEVSAGRYEMTRDAFLVTRRESPPAVRDLVRYFLSGNVAEVLSRNGAAAVNTRSGAADNSASE